MNGETPPFGANNDEPEITSGEGVLFNGNALERGPKDVPLHIRAPRDAGNDGTVLVELDLDTAYDFDGAPAIPVKLDFLKFDWRSVNANITAPLSGDVDPDGTQDNPRAMVEFGTFRGNDRIINWQEIFE